MNVAQEDATISVNGGPRVPLTVAIAAMDAVKKRSKRPSAQTDLEDPDQLGTVPANDARVAGIAADRLRSLVERIEALEAEKKALGEDVKDLFVETKSAGFDPKVVRRLIAERKRDRAEVENEQDLLDLYRRAVGA